MSLINDALQRAKQQTTQPAPNPTLPLRPIESARTPRKKSAPLLSLACASVLIVGAVLGLMALKANRAKETIVEAKSKPVESVAAPQTAPTEKPIAAKLEEAKPVATKTTEATTQATNSLSMTAEPPAPRPAPLKLQAILFSTTKPSAIVNGKTVYVGNRVGEFRVASITQTNATLINESATNILSFQE